MIILKFVETVGLYFCVCDGSLDALSKVQQMPSTSLAFAIGYDVCTSVLASLRLSRLTYRQHFFTAYMLVTLFYFSHTYTDRRTNFRRGPTERGR